MPVKRRVSKVRDGRITDEALDAFDQCLKLEATGRDREETEHGWCKTEAYNDARRALHIAIGHKPWEDSPLHVPAGAPFPKWLEKSRHDYWTKASEQRRDLENALKERKRNQQKQRMDAIR